MSPKPSSPKPATPNARVIALLGIAIAILGEEMNTLGVQAPKSAARHRRIMRELIVLSRDAAILAEACDVLRRRPGLKL